MVVEKRLTGDPVLPVKKNRTCDGPMPQVL